jgi:hypothetical protein
MELARAVNVNWLKNTFNKLICIDDPFFSGYMESALLLRYYRLRIVNK